MISMAHLAALYQIFLSIKCCADPRASVNIGAVVNMFTGNQVSQISVLLRSMMLMAVDEINNKLDNRDHLLPSTVVKLIFSDPRGSYYNGISAAQYVASSSFNGTGSDLCIGSGSTPIAKAIGEVLPQFNIMQLSYSSDSQFTYSSVFPNMFRTIVSLDFQGRGLADLCFSHFGWRKVSIFSSNDYFGNCALTEFQLRASSLGISILSAQQFIQHDTDFTHVIERAAASYASIFVILADSLDTSNLLQAGYDAGLFVEGTQVLGTSFAVATTSNVNAMYKGFIGLNPTVDLTNAKLLAFVKKFSLLKPTVTTSSTGTKICSNIVDDNGSYVFKGTTDYRTTSPYTCAGTSDYSIYSNPSSVPLSIFYAYDAMYAGFHALHNYIYDVGINNVRSVGFQSFLRNNVSFEGVTGNISFSSGLLRLSTFSAGSRRIGAYYQIVNYQLCETNITTKTTTTATTVLCAKNIGAWHGELGFKDCKLAGFSDCAEVVYNTADNSRPLDWPAIKYALLSTSSQALLWMMAAIVIVVVVICAGIVSVFRQTTIIKLSQPSMLYFILFGCLLGAGRIVVSIYEPTVFICIGRTWLSHLAFAIVFGTLFLKTWRVHRLVNGGMKRVVITTHFINGTVFGTIGMVCLYLLVITLISTPYVSYSTTYVTNHATRQGRCSLHHPSYSTTLLVLEGLSLAVGARLCWLTKGVPDEVNESVYIASAIIGIAFICLVDFPAVYLLNLNPSSIRLVSSVGFFLAIIWTLAAQFGPKVYILWAESITNHQVKKVEVNLGRSPLSPRHSSPGQDNDPPPHRTKIVMIPSPVYHDSDSVVPFTNTECDAL